MQVKIDCLAREPHHQKHARAIFDKLPDDVRGTFFDNVAEFATSPNPVVLVSAYGDLKFVARYGRKAIFMEHGVGLFYNTAHPSYAGSLTDRDCIILQLSPNERHAARVRDVLSCPVEVVGVPKMDEWAGKDLTKRRREYYGELVPLRKLTIAVSFHFDCVVCPETRSAYQTYLPYLGRLVAAGYKVLGHGHPRIFKKIEPIYRSLGIKPVEDFDEVMRSADVYMCDNSSTIFEFAFTGKPVILLNCQFYRRDVSHAGNPRFWQYADLGYNVNGPNDLLNAVEWTRTHTADLADRQREIVQDMFTYTDGRCAERSVAAILKHVTSNDIGLPDVQAPL